VTGRCKPVYESSGYFKEGISLPAERTTATADVGQLCSMELAGETWVCRRLEHKMAGHLQTDFTAQFEYTKRTNSGMLKNYYYHHHHHHHHHHPHPSLQNS
jgi:hypothetical protein